MSIFEYITSSMRCLASSKMRTFLTALGIIVGISSVILINIIGNSLGKTVENFMSAANGGNKAHVAAEIKYDSLVFDSTGFIDTDSLKKLKLKRFSPEMIAELEEHFDNRIQRYERSTDYSGASFADNDNQTGTTLTLVSPSVKRSDRIEMLKGRFVNESDVERKSAVAVIPEQAAKKYFGKENPVGRTFTFCMNGSDGLWDAREFTVIGVYKPDTRAQFLLENAENTSFDCFVPYTWNENPDHVVRSLTYVIDDLEDPKSFSDETYDCLGYYFEGADTRLSVETVSDISSKVDSVVKIVTKVISAIAAVSLLVGGIGVMNIMLVSVSERTMEIGVRKAMGADNGSIRMQFLAESVLITLIGSFLGILLGAAEAKLIALIALKIAEAQNFALSVNLSIPYKTVLAAVIFSFAIGIIFGVYPADKAAKMEVVDALRYE